MNSPADLDELVAEVQAGAKYAPIDPGFVRRLLERELANSRSRKELVKAVRNKLHQVGGAYQEKPIVYTKWSERLAGLLGDVHSEPARQFCLEMMAEHTSTRERLPYLERFYAETLAPIQPLRSLLDLACGLNPLAFSWMPLSPDVTLQVCDIYADQAAFLNRFFAHFAIAGQASVCDLTQSVPQQPVQLALLLKTIPCLEQVDKAIGRRLLGGIQAEHILVTFPAHSLGGKSKGMRSNYDAHFLELLAGLPFDARRFDFPGELAYLLTRK